MEVYTGSTGDGRFLNGAELTCLMATRLVAFCLWNIDTGVQATREGVNFNMVAMNGGLLWRT